MRRNQSKVIKFCLQRIKLLTFTHNTSLLINISKFIRNSSIIVILAVFILFPVRVSGDSTSDFVAAERLFNNEIIRNPNNDEANFFLGVLYYKNGKVINSIKFFSNAVKFNKNHDKAKLFLCSSLNTLGCALARAEEYDKAIKSFSLASNNLFPKDKIFISRFNRALAYIKKGEPEKAKNDITFLLETNEDVALKLKSNFMFVEFKISCNYADLDLIKQYRENILEKELVAILKQGDLTKLSQFIEKSEGFEVCKKAKEIYQSKIAKLEKERVVKNWYNNIFKKKYDLIMHFLTKSSDAYDEDNCKDMLSYFDIALVEYFVRKDDLMKYIGEDTTYSDKAFQEFDKMLTLLHELNIKSQACR